MKPAMLVDTTRCRGCEACVLACQEANGLPRDDGVERLSATTWTVVEEHGGVHVKRQCMHCLDPACVSVCPVGALQKTPEGPVVYEESRCMGCRYCMVACPFSVPRYEWDSTAPRVQKCILCYHERVSAGEQPACAEVCPTGALTFGDRDELIDEAARRIEAEPERYVDHLYGLEEAGGTSVLYLSSVPFEELGLPTVHKGDPYPRLTWDVLSKLPNVVGVAGVLLLGVWWVTGRRDVLARVRGGELTMEEAMKLRPPLAEPDPASGRAANDDGSVLR